jgi:hypothetical protein
MKSITKTIAVATALAFAAGLPLAGYAADDAKAPVAKANETKSGTKSDTPPAKTPKVKRTKKEGAADAKAVNSTNDTKGKEK